MELRSLIREMAGRNRCDLSPLLADARAFQTLVAQLADPFASERVTHVAGIDAMGFVLGGAVAVQLGAAAELCGSSGATIVGAAVINADPGVRAGPPANIQVLHTVFAY